MLYEVITGPGSVGVPDHRELTDPLAALEAHLVDLAVAMDDPFLPSRAIPMDAIRDNPALEGRVLPRGGHVA